LNSRGAGEFVDGGPRSPPALAGGRFSFKSPAFEQAKPPGGRLSSPIIASTAGCISNEPAFAIELRDFK
jgi:hypothetical protein